MENLHNWLLKEIEKKITSKILEGSLYNGSHEDDDQDTLVHLPVGEKCSDIIKMLETQFSHEKIKVLICKIINDSYTRLDLQNGCNNRDINSKKHSYKIIEIKGKRLYR